MVTTHINGGLGQDLFEFDNALNALTNVDTIQGFNHADDTIQLRSGVFTGPSVITADMYHVGAAAADSNDYIINNTVSCVTMRMVMVQVLYSFCDLD